ncbi:MAG: helix-turn-helix domain-containing protein [Chromatiales bacterium]|nr:helix-turn-helix domain-containing protein [Chromatiales bacterium]
MKKLLDPKTPAARWELIKGALRARGSSLSAIALQIGLTKEAVGKVNRHPYPAVEAAIASELGVAPQDLWPERYQGDGTPRRRRPRAPTANLRIRKSTKVNVNSMASGNTRGGDAA